MPGIARSSASKGRLRPSFFFLPMLVFGAALAQPPVYRCGQQYTNAPADPGRCERLSGQAVTVIPGTRVQTAEAPAAGRAVTGTPQLPAAKVAEADQRQRDGMARAIVSAELDKARQRHAELERQYRQAPPPHDSAPRSQLQAAVERAQRDIDSLHRELSRHPAGHAQP